MYQGTEHTFTISGLLTADSVMSRIVATGGVLIQLVAKHAGLRFGVSANGVQIRFKHSF